MADAWLRHSIQLPMSELLILVLFCDCSATQRLRKRNSRTTSLTAPLGASSASCFATLRLCGEEPESSVSPQSGRRDQFWSDLWLDLRVVSKMTQFDIKVAEKR